jgi:hypothetical protein
MAGNNADASLTTRRTGISAFERDFAKNRTITGAVLGLSSQ